jgi:cellulose biosynthesis protein BcsQ
MFSQEKMEELKKIKQELGKISTTQVINILGEDIIELVNKGTTLKLLSNKLSEKLDTKISYEYLSQWIKKMRNNMQKNAEQEEETPQIDNNQKKKTFTLIANDKGGVGKTTLATLLNLPNSLILNLDRTREITDIYPYKTIVDFAKVEEEEGVELEDFLAILKEDENFENIIIDTKGGINEDLITILPYIDSIIVPIKVGATSENPSYDFIIQLNSLVEELDKDIYWAIVYNEISPKFLKKVGFGKYKLLDEFDEIEKALKNDILGDKLKVITYFKRSEAITTREKERKDIKDLMKKNFGAYLVVKKEIDRLNKDLKDIYGK